MLDTFAKRLASQGRPSPGDISIDDRWAIGGTFKPTITAGGLLAAVAAVSVAAFTGTFTPGVLSAFNQADRFHITHRPFPGDLQIENRAAIGGSFVYLESSSDSTGLISAHASGSTAALVGQASSGPPPPASFDPDDRWHLEWRPYPANGSLGREDRLAIGARPARLTGTAPIGGALVTTGAPARAAFLGSSYYSLFFDVDYSVTPAITFRDITASAGALTLQANAAIAQFLGTVLPPNSESGFIAANAAASVAALVGTFTLAPGRDGRIHADPSSAFSQLHGTVVPPSGRIGKVSTTAAASSAHFAGTFVKAHFDGHITLHAAASTTRWYGQSILAATINGHLAGHADPSTAMLRGTSHIASPGRIVGRRGKGTVRGTKASATIKGTKGKGNV